MWKFGNSTNLKSQTGVWGTQTIAGKRTGLEKLLFDNMHPYVLIEIRKCSSYFACCNCTDTGATVHERPFYSHLLYAYFKRRSSRGMNN